ncbi:MAG: MarR family transcriptional regulator [Actinomycetota bacterium]
MQSVDTPPDVDALVQLSFTVQLVLTRIATEHDLSVTQLRMLGILRDRTPTMAQIADYLELDRSSVSGLVDRAERRGLVARRPSEKDARVTLVEATPGGFAVGERIAAAVTSGIQALLEGSPRSEVDAVMRLSARATHS